MAALAVFALQAFFCVMSFRDVVLARRRLPTSVSERSQLRNVYGTLRGHMRDFPMYMADLRPQIERILGRLVQLQRERYAGIAWDDHWKEVSREGFDLISNAETDYGNVEYYVLLGCFCHWSPYCYQCMVWLAG